jgi:hypothetical protein
LKIVFLQNSIFFQQEYSDYPNFKYPLFEIPEYAEFAAKIKKIIILNFQSVNIQLHAVVLGIEKVLRIIAFIISAGNTNFVKKINFDFNDLFREIRFISI